MEPITLDPMSKLQFAIGPAPSEMPFSDLIELCRNEIFRSRELLTINPRVPKSRIKKAKPRITKSDTQELAQMMEEFKNAST